LKSIDEASSRHFNQYSKAEFQQLFISFLQSVKIDCYRQLSFLLLVVIFRQKNKEAVVVLLLFFWLNVFVVVVVVEARRRHARDP
jgi:hypothetical protein